MLAQLIYYLDAGFRWFLALLMAAMVLCVTWQIVSRYLLADPSQWTEELARFLLIWIGLLGGSYAYHVKMHLGLDLLSQKLRGNPRKVYAVVVHALVAVFSAAVFVVGGLRIVQMTTELKQYSAALGVPMAFVYSALPISGAMLILYAVVGMVAALRGDDDLSGVNEMEPAQ